MALPAEDDSRDQGDLDGDLVPATLFRQAFGESVASALDLNTWQPGPNLQDLYERLEAEVQKAVGEERSFRSRTRAMVLPKLRTRPEAPPGAGVYQVTMDQLARVHKGLLFNGGVEACDGTCVTHETLPLTIVQIGISLVSYQGDQGSWVQRLFRRDLRVGGRDPVADALAVLEHRRNRDLDNPTGSGRDKLSELARRGIMTYAERAVLLTKSDALWRMGHGIPAPYELITGSGSMEFLERSLDVLSELLLKHKRYVFVPSEASAFMRTLGDALNPLEFAIVDYGAEQMSGIVERGKYDPRYKRLVRDFMIEVGSRMVAGVFRASLLAPARVFYAHVDFAPDAAAIALADSTLQEHRGFPLLIDISDAVCRSTFGADAFADAVRVAYAEAGEPYRYLGERETRA